MAPADHPDAQGEVMTDRQAGFVYQSFLDHLPMVINKPPFAASKLAAMLMAPNYATCTEEQFRAQSRRDHLERYEVTGSIGYSRGGRLLKNCRWESTWVDVGLKEKREGWELWADSITWPLSHISARGVVYYLKRGRFDVSGDRDALVAYADFGHTITSGGPIGEEPNTKNGGAYHVHFRTPLLTVPKDRRP
jgi:hypothetical protein